MNIYQVWGFNKETNKEEYLGAFLNRGAAEIMISFNKNSEIYSDVWVVETYEPYEEDNNGNS